MICPSEYLSQWAMAWGIRETIERRTGLTPRLHPHLGALTLEHDGRPSAALVACSESCDADLMILVARLDRATIRE